MWECVGSSIVAVAGADTHEIYFCNFVRNAASGSVLGNDNANPQTTVSKCVFVGNAGNRIFPTSPHFIVTDCVFSGAPAAEPGSATDTFIDPGVEPLPMNHLPLQGCLGLTPAPSPSRAWIECTVFAIPIAHTELTDGCVNVSDVIFEDLAATGAQWGGAIHFGRTIALNVFCTHDYYAVIAHCSFLSCTSGQWGGALGLSQVGVQIDRTCAELCYSSLGGHFLYAIEPCDLHSIDLSSVSQCAPSGLAVKWGAVDLQAPPIFSFSSVNFSKCESTERGAAFGTDWYNDATFSMLHMQFEGCAGSSIVWIASNSIQDIESSNFISNKPSEGGVIAAHTEHPHIIVRQVTVRGCVFQGNTGSTFWSDGLVFAINDCVLSGTIGTVPHSGTSNIENANSPPLSLELWDLSSCPFAKSAVLTGTDTARASSTSIGTVMATTSAALPRTARPVGTRGIGIVLVDRKRKSEHTISRGDQIGTD
jgi:hypothetical protein